MIMRILGLYIGKIFDQVKGRMIYFTKDKINIEDLSNDHYKLSFGRGEVRGQNC